MVGIKSTKKSHARYVLSSAILAASLGLNVSSAAAQEYLPGILSPSFVDEIRLGVLYNDLHIAGTRDEDGININGEILFRRPNYSYENRFLQFFLNPRPHIGASLNTAGDTSQAYVGLTWDYRLTEKFFVEASFGGVVHTGNLKSNVQGSKRPLGCRVMFRESASIGYEVTPKVRVMLTFDHISNANLCSNNAGLSTIGGRIGYKF